MTATSSPTDRYVAATLRSLPERQRQDIEAELRALIADAIDDPRKTGLSPIPAIVDAVCTL